MLELDAEELSRRASIINDSYNGVIPYHRAFYIESILYSASRSLSAFEKYRKLLDKDADPTILVSQVQEAVAHAASLSRYFWPPENKKSRKEIQQLRMNRAEELRNTFNLTDSSPLKNRELRNAWEHFEEKLDVYLLSIDAGYLFPTPMIGKHELADEPLGKIFKLLDLEAACLVLLNKKFFFQPIYLEVKEIYLHGIHILDND